MYFRGDWQSKILHKVDRLLALVGFDQFTQITLNGLLNEWNKLLDIVISEKAANHVSEGSR